MIAESVYILCALTSIACAYMLLRAWSRNRKRMLFWSAVCFVCIALSNIVLVADLVLFPESDFYMLRSIPALIGVSALVSSFVWECP